jgi:hypothetical protein
MDKESLTQFPSKMGRQQTADSKQYAIVPLFIMHHALVTYRCQKQ